VLVWVQGSEYIVIKLAGRGRRWSWEYGGRSGSCAAEDWDAMAETMARFIAEEPSLAATAARFRLGIEEAEVQRQAAGLTRQQIARHVKEAHAAFTAAAPGPGREAAAALRARARWMEWWRIERFLDGARMQVYDPAQDPASVNATAGR
jgi:hypothetical protein